MGRRQRPAAGWPCPPEQRIAQASARYTGHAATRARQSLERPDVITPGTSGILALVTATDAPAVVAKMPGAAEVKTVTVDEETAGAIKEAAAEAEATSPSGS